MTRDEKIINDAKEFYSDNIKCYDAFLHGVEWADENPNLESIWHDATEEPEGTYSVLCDGLDDTQWIINSNYIDIAYANWKDYTEYIDVARWAYIKDILPKGGEK